MGLVVRVEGELAGDVAVPDVSTGGYRYRQNVVFVVNYPSNNSTSEFQIIVCDDDCRTVITTCQ
jgi:hypothetical protein